MNEVSNSGLSLEVSMVSTINKNLVAPPRLHELAFSTLLKTKPEKKKKKTKRGVTKKYGVQSWISIVYLYITL
jgi:hypothetical protein